MSNQRSDRKGASRRLLLRLAVTPVVLMFASAAYAEGDEKAGAVEDIKGEAFAEKDSKRRDLERAAPLYMQDQVGTGAASRLTVRLGRDTTLRLGERARIVIDRYLVDVGGEIRLESGPLLFDRAGSSPAQVQIRSQFGLIAVRGTRFFAGPINGGFAVFVERGSVEVSAAGRHVVVLAGEGTDIRWPGAVPTYPVRWRERRIRAALASVQ